MTIRTNWLLVIIGVGVPVLVMLAVNNAQSMYNKGWNDYGQRVYDEEQAIKRRERTVELVLKEKVSVTTRTWRDKYPAAVEAVLLLRMHESLDGKMMVGDRGAARGWLQQHKAHWEEGSMNIGVQWRWPHDTYDLQKCEDVAFGYWRRHARKYLEANDVEELIRRFRLPYDPYRPSNDEYLVKVLARRTNR